MENLDIKDGTSEWKRRVAIFLGSQTISLFGSSLVQYAIMWYITLETKSGAMMTISILCGFLPTLLLSPFAGVWADRFDRKKLIIFADSGIAITTLILAISFLTGHGAVWQLFVASALRALGAAIQMPAVGAFLPQIVPEDKLMRVNGINGSIQSATMLISPMVSGALLTFASIEKIFFIDVITAAIGVGILAFFLKVEKPAGNEGPDGKKSLKPTYFGDMKVGLIYIWNHRFLKVFFGFSAVLLFLVAPAAFLTPLQVTRVFGSEVWRLTTLEVCFSLGMIAGGVALSIWGGFKNRAYTMVLGNGIMGICTIALGMVNSFYAYLIYLGIFGIALTFFNTPSMVLIQEKVEEEYMGRVFGVMTMISSSMMPLGMLFFGPIADKVSIEVILVVTGILISGSSFSMLRSDLCRLDHGSP